MVKIAETTDAAGYATLPSVHSLLGTQGRQDLLDAVSRDWGNGVVYGTPDDPFRDHYQSWMQQVIQPVNTTQAMVQDGQAAMAEAAEFVAVQTAAQLKEMPPDQYVPVLTDPVIRSMLENDQIHGFGIDPSTLPEGDRTGRLIANGMVTSEDLSGQSEDEQPTMSWEWRSDDPDWSQDDIDALHDTRQYIVDNFLAEWLGTGEAVAKDPTHPEEYLD